MPFVIVLIALMLALGALPDAHHSWTVEYDAGRPVAVKGVVTKVEWTNPHTHIYVDVKDDQGGVINWNFEMASTLALERGGWSRRTLQPGDHVTIAGYAGRVVTIRSIATAVTTADGREFFVGTPGN